MNTFLFIVFVLLNIADLYLTEKALATGRAKEKNPLGRLWGRKGRIGLKVAGLIVIGFITFKSGHAGLVAVLLCLVNALYGILCYRNYRVWRNVR